MTCDSYYSYSVLNRSLDRHSAIVAYVSSLYSRKVTLKCELIMLKCYKIKVDIIHPAYVDGYKFSRLCSDILSVPKAVIVKTVTAYIFQVCQVS